MAVAMKITDLPPPEWLNSDVYSFSFQRQAKYSENKLKCTKARNDYLLNLAATNAAISKYYIHDVSDLIDVSTLGAEWGHNWAGTPHQLRGLPLVLTSGVARSLEPSWKGWAWNV